MKYVVVAGCRDFTDYYFARQAIAEFLTEYYPNQPLQSSCNFAHSGV